MPLDYPAEWRFGEDGVNVPAELNRALQDLITKIASSFDDPKSIVESFKSRFGAQASSSSLDCAYSDLASAMDDFGSNGALFTEAVWLAIQDAAASGAAVPSHELVNAVLAKHKFPYRIEPPHLLRLDAHAASGQGGAAGSPRVTGNEGATSDMPCPRAEVGVAPDEAYHDSLKSSDRSESIGLTPQHTALPRRLEADWQREYQKVRNLDSGGYAEVFEASRKSTGEKEAIKVPKPEPDAIERFQKEVSEQSKCEHPHVMPIVNSGENWYAMPLADGTLKTLAPGLSEEERVIVVDQVAEGLAHAHGMLVVHRDVTPGNILRIKDARGQRWVVGDFGLVRRPRGQTTGPHTRGPVGTQGFVAPEMAVLGAHGVDQRADVYSFGYTIAFMVTGAWPDELSGVELPPAWAPLVGRMTADALDERCQNMDEVRAALNAVTEAIRRERAVKWKLSSGASTLKPYELGVLAAILDEGEGGSRYDAFRRLPGLRPREVSLGLIALRKRGFIKDSLNDHGEPWGIELTSDGVAWVLANDHLVLAASPGEAEEQAAPAPGGDDDIPF